MKPLAKGKLRRFAFSGYIAYFSAEGIAKIEHSQK
jgi:hypothetical protein